MHGPSCYARAGKTGRRSAAVCSGGGGGRVLPPRAAAGQGLRPDVGWASSHMRLQRSLFELSIRAAWRVLCRFRAQRRRECGTPSGPRGCSGRRRRACGCGCCWVNPLLPLMLLSGTERHSAARAAGGLRGAAPRGALITMRNARRGAARAPRWASSRQLRRRASSPGSAPRRQDGRLGCAHCAASSASSTSRLGEGRSAASSRRVVPEMAEGKVGAVRGRGHVRCAIERASGSHSGSDGRVEGASRWLDVDACTDTDAGPGCSIQAGCSEGKRAGVR